VNFVAVKTSISSCTSLLSPSARPAGYQVRTFFLVLTSFRTCLAIEELIHSRGWLVRLRKLRIHYHTIHTEFYCTKVKSLHKYFKKNGCMNKKRD